jgi:hypothetical protein
VIERNGAQMQARIRKLEQSYKGLLRIHQKTKREKLILARCLIHKQLEIQRSNYVFGPRIHSLLVQNLELQRTELQIYRFMLRFALGRVAYEHLKQDLQNKLSAKDLGTLYSFLNGHSRLKTNRALILIFHLYGVPKDAIVSALGIFRRSVTKHIRVFKRFGVDSVFPPRRGVVKW